MTPVVSGYNLNTRREARLKFLNLLLHILYHIEGILAKPHYNNAACNLTLSIPFYNPPSLIGTKLNTRNILNPDRRPALIYLKNDILYVRKFLYITKPPDHILTLCQLNNPPPDINISHLYRVHYVFESDVVSK